MTLAKVRNKPFAYHPNDFDWLFDGLLRGGKDNIQNSKNTTYPGNRREQMYPNNNRQQYSVHFFNLL